MQLLSLWHLWTILLLTWALDDLHCGCPSCACGYNSSFPWDFLKTICKCSHSNTIVVLLLIYPNILILAAPIVWTHCFLFALFVFYSFFAFIYFFVLRGGVGGCSWDWIWNSTLSPQSFRSEWGVDRHGYFVSLRPKILIQRIRW